MAVSLARLFGATLFGLADKGAVKAANVDLGHSLASGSPLRALFILHVLLKLLTGCQLLELLASVLHLL